VTGVRLGLDPPDVDGIGVGLPDRVAAMLDA
jgi:hypothetical protein